MKAKILTITLVLFTIVSFSQNNSNSSNILSENSIYQLFPTDNFWTFIKLDTRNGKMWQVQFSINEEDTSGELVLNSEPLVTIEDEFNGRFTLYPTENMFNFILLDKKNGMVYQAQWSLEKEFRGIIPIN